MADQQVKLTFRISDDGTLSVLDEVGRKVRQVGADADRATTQAASGFTRWQASIVAVNQGLALAQQVTGSATRLLREFAIAPLQGIDSFKELSTSIGLSVEEVTSLRVAAKLGGAELSALGRSVAFFQRQLQNARAGGSRADLFEQLGIDISTGRRTIEVLEDTGAALGRIESDSRRVAAATELFGRGGSRQLNVFNAQLRELIALNKQVGLTITEDVAAKAERLSDKLDLLTLATQSSKEQFALGFQPAIEASADALSEFAGINADVAAQDTRSWAQRTGEAFSAVLVPAIAESVRELRELKAGFESIYSLVGGPAAKELDERIAQANQRGDIVAAGRAYRDYALSLAGQRQPLSVGVIAGGGSGPRFLPPGGPIFGPEDPFEGGQSTDPSLAFGDPFTGSGTQPYFVPPPARGSGAAASSAAAALASRERAEIEAFAEAERVRVALLQQQVTLRDQAVRQAQEELSVAQRTGASQQEQLALAARLDELERLRLASTRERLQAELDGLLQFGPAISSQIVDLQTELYVVDEQLSRAPDHAAAMRREFERARAELVASRRVVVDLGETLNSSLQASVQGLLSRDGRQDLGDVIEGTGQAIAAEFVGGFLQAELAKNSFDAMVGENFTVTLPGFMREGADSIASIWSGLMDSLGFSTNQTASGIQQSFADRFNAIGSNAQTLGGTLNGLGRAGGYASDVVGIDASGRSIVENELGQRFSGPGAAEVAGGTPQPSGGDSLGGLGGIGAAALTFGATVALDLALNGKDRYDALIKNSNLLRNTLDRGDIAKAIGGGGIVGGLGALLAENPILDVIFGGSVFSVFNVLEPPTGGTQRKIGLQAAAKKAGLPEQTVFSFGGEQGIRSKYFEVTPDAAAAAAFAAAGFGFDQPGLRQPTLSDLGGGGAARNLQAYLQKQAELNPGVEALRTNESLALGVLVTGRERSGINVANAFTNNLLALGVSEGEARRQTRVLAEQQGLNLQNSIEEAQRLYLQNVLKDDPTTAANEKTQKLLTIVEGAVGIFEDDIPAGVDVSALAVANFTEQAGIDIAAFNEDLERALTIFGQLQETVGGGLRTGIAGATGALTDAVRARDAGDLTGAVRLSGEARTTLRDAVASAVGEGIETALLERAFDAVKDSPAFKAFEETVAGVVTGKTSATDVAAQLDALVNSAVPILTATAEAIVAVEAALETSTRALEQLRAVTDAAEQGLSDGLGSVLDAFAARERAQREALAGGGSSTTIGDLVKASSRARAALGTALADTVRLSFVTGLQTALTGAIEDLPAWKALTSAINEAVKSGDLSTLPALLATATREALPLIESAARALDEANKLFAVTPFALQAQADTIREDVEGKRRDLLSPAQRERQARADIADADQQLARLRGDNTPDNQQAQEILDLLNERNRASSDLVGVVGDRYDLGTVSGRRRYEDALAEQERTADLFEEFGVTQQTAIEATQSLTGATEENTTATTGLTALINEALTGGSVSIDELIRQVNVEKKRNEILAGGSGSITDLIKLVNGGSTQAGATQGDGVRVSGSSQAGFSREGEVQAFERYGVPAGSAYGSASIDRNTAALERLAQKLDEQGGTTGGGGTSVVVVDELARTDPDQFARQVSDTIEKGRLQPTALRRLKREMAAH